MCCIIQKNYSRWPKLNEKEFFSFINVWLDLLCNVQLFIEQKLFNIFHAGNLLNPQSMTVKTHKSMHMVKQKNSQARGKGKR